MTDLSVNMSPTGDAIIEQVIALGDLDKLSPQERVSYYQHVCKSVGLNPLTQPFAYIRLNGKLVLYAAKGCTDQLRTLRGVSVEEMTESERGDVYVVTAKVRDATGRTDMAKGAVPIANLKGEALANAIMKAETKAKRRATLSICGLGMLDETELETIPNSVKQVPLEAVPAVTRRAPMPEPLPEPAFDAGVVDEETGEVGPHKITVPITPRGNVDWISWGSQLGRALNASRNREEGEAWLEANAASLNDCQADHPGVYKKLSLNAQQMRCTTLTAMPPSDRAAH